MEDTMSCGSKHGSEVMKSISPMKMRASRIKAMMLSKKASKKK
jgi:hypothetical protein